MSKEYDIDVELIYYTTVRVEADSIEQAQEMILDELQVFPVDYSDGGAIMMPWALISPIATNGA